MDRSVIVIDDLENEPPHVADNASPHVASDPQPGPSTSSSNAVNAPAGRQPYNLRGRDASVSQPRPNLSPFELKRKRHEQRTHPTARRKASAKSKSSNHGGDNDGNRIPVSRQNVTIAKKKVPKKSNRVNKLLIKHQKTILLAKIKEAKRARLGLPPSRLRIPSMNDSESAHREFYVKNMEAQKIEEDIKKGYIVRVEDRHAIQLDDLDPELLTGRELTEKEAYWVAKKQARRAGPRSSSWPSIVPVHDQHTEYIRLTDKARNMFDPNAPECSECGSKLWGTNILFPLSRPADVRPSRAIVDPNAPLCVGCSRLFSCVKDRKEKMEMIEWIINRKTSYPAEPQETMDAELSVLCQRRVYGMKYRSQQHYSNPPANFVTPDELFTSVKNDNYHCYLVGSPMRLKPGFYDSLTFDHIFPISIAMMKPNCWSIENLQPMSFCMNQVKGNEANKEAKRWLINYKMHYYSPNFKA